MWETLRSHPLGRLSMRNFFAVATSLLVACFVYILASSPVAGAADATWQNGTLSYEDKTYRGPIPSTQQPAPAIPDNIDEYYLAVEDSQGPNTSSRRAHIIYFAPGNDPGTATSAQYQTFSYSNTSYSNPSAVISITVNPTNAAALSDGTSSCKVDNIGWLVCGFAGFLADGMDYLYGVITQFLVVQPISDGNNSMYRAWSIAKDFANIVFIIGFLIIIYSHLIGGGLSAYNIRKILPRIVIAAILVNISYWICAIAVDISNIAGQSLQDLFANIRENIVGTEVNTSIGWGEITGYILSGGTIGTIGILAATGGSITSAAFLVVGLLITVLFAGLIAVIVLAARQALITILIVIAPLAFVAYLLPNTEKWFEKWRSISLTLLLVFPIFSVIFGGSQLASAIIIQNAQHLSVMLLGMAVQVAPLVITPLLIRFSGGIIGRIAGMANDTSKGAVDGAKNWARGNADHHKARALGTPTRGYSVARRAAQRMNRGKMYREGMTKSYQQGAENLFNDSAKGHKLHEAHHWSEREKERVTKSAEEHLNKKIYADKSLLEREMRVRITSDAADVASRRLDAVHKEVQAGSWDAFGTGPQNQSLMEAIDKSGEATRELSLTAMRVKMAERKQTENLSEQIKNNTLTIDGKSLQEYGGGVMGRQGELSIRADAETSADKLFMDDAKNIEDTLSHGIKTNNDELITRFKTSTTMAERIAYANSMAKNGAPGIQKLQEAFTHFESTNPSVDDLNGFKSLVGLNAGIRSAGKDFDDWINNSKDTSGNTMSYSVITNSIDTWRNLSPNKFAAMNADRQEHALRMLESEPAIREKLIASLGRSDKLGDVKIGVQDKL